MVQVVYTQLQYTTLCAAIAQGVTSVKYGDKEVIYRNLEEMLRIKALMEAQLFPNNKRNKVKVVQFTKGLR